MVKEKDSDKPRGYAFIEFEHERDMRAAYKHAEGMKIDGRRVLVDVERGRTVTDWKPRRLGGGVCVCVCVCVCACGHACRGICVLAEDFS